MVSLITALVPIVVVGLIVVLVWSMIAPKKSIANSIVEQTVPNVSTIVDKVSPKNMETDHAEEEAVIAAQQRQKERLHDTGREISKQNDAINASKSRAGFTL